MTERVRFRPFTGDSERRVLLTEAPLELVLCQVRWPDLTHLRQDFPSTAAKFGAQLSGYPLYNESEEVGFTFTPEGVSQVAGGKLFHWTSVDNLWQITLGQRFVTLACRKYSNFGDFSLRLQDVLAAIHSAVEVPIVERVGVRYVNRIRDIDVLNNLGDYVEPEVMGYTSLSADSAEVQLEGTANQARYRIGEIQLQARSGVLARGETVDPAIQPSDERSWVLDLDASNETRQFFSVDAMVESAGKLSDTAYDFFKRVTKQTFVDHFGG